MLALLGYPRTAAGDGRASSRLRRASPHHLCETFDEERYTLEHYSLRPVAWMETMGWLGDDVWFAHAVHVNDDEIREFARTGAGVAHCPARICGSPLA